MTDGRNARQSVRVAFSDAASFAQDTTRNVRHSVRVALTGAVTTVQVAAVQLRVLTAPTGGRALLDGFQVRVLRDNLGTPVTAAQMKVWTGSAFTDAPARVWTGSAFVDAVAVKTWNGSAFT